MTAISKGFIVTKVIVPIASNTLHENVLSGRSDLREMAEMALAKAFARDTYWIDDDISVEITGYTINHMNEVNKKMIKLLREDKRAGEFYNPKIHQVLNRIELFGKGCPQSTYNKVKDLTIMEFMDYIGNKYTYGKIKGMGRKLRTRAIDIIIRKGLYDRRQKGKTLFDIRYFI